MIQIKSSNAEYLQCLIFFEHPNKKKFLMIRQDLIFHVKTLEIVYRIDTVSKYLLNNFILKKYVTEFYVVSAVPETVLL